jgi:ABC-2 type transport system permease protein
MRSIWIIAKKELQSFFDSLIAYIMIVLFLGFSGFFTWLYGSDVFLVGQANLNGFFSIAFWTLFFFIPAITMRTLAEERKTGTIELLLTKAVTDRQVILGKFLASLLLVVIALAFTLPYYITLASIGSVDHGAILTGYLGLIFLSAAYISIGLFTSSLTGNQIVAFLLALFIGLFFHLIFDVLAGNFTGFTGQLFTTLSLTSHFDSMSRGVLDSKDIIYFLSIIVIGVFLSELNLAKRNLAN